MGWWYGGLVISLERGADLHTAQLMPLLLAVFCFSKIQIGFTFLVLAHLDSPGRKVVKCAHVCACVRVWFTCGLAVIAERTVIIKHRQTDRQK